MKDKIIAFSTLGLVFGLFFYYKVVSPVDLTSDNGKDNVINDTFEFEKVKLDNNDISIQDNEVNLNVDSQCNLSEDETNILDFSSAFKYYRICNEPGNNFVWKGDLYSTLLKAEVEDKIIITNNSVVNNESADKNHLNLQNQLIGMDIK